MREMIRSISGLNSNAASRSEIKNYSGRQKRILPLSRTIRNSRKSACAENSPSLFFFFYSHPSFSVSDFHHLSFAREARKDKTSGWSVGFPGNDSANLAKIEQIVVSRPCQVFQRSLSVREKDRERKKARERRENTLLYSPFGDKANATTLRIKVE